MFIEMIDLLRCPRDHEETWLVASFTQMDGRFVVHGKLGCPVCSASYDIVDGVAIFGEPASDAFAPVVNPESVMRTAALLNLTRPGSTVILCGDEAIASQEVAELTQCRVIALNPSADIEDTDRVATVTCGGRIPLATASVDAIAIGDRTTFFTDAGRVLRPSARLTARPDASLPGGFRELARDDLNIVAESMGPLVGLSRVSTDPR
jgi:uncharacterized protein YbaR (Trm112 family)